MDILRVRLNCLDHYQSTPTVYDPQLRSDIGILQASKGPKVPVVRVFGSTETGQKVCAHIHGAFPYLYVEYHGNLESGQVGAFIYRLHVSIDHALAVSYRRKHEDESAKFVARITLVKGVPFYGFHVGYRFFLKIYLFNPNAMSRLADLLQQGVILKQKFQLYEAHLQYISQFMIDYNLYGCDFLDAAKVMFRSPIPEHGPASDASTQWDSLSVAPEFITDEVALPRSSHSSIEVDICAQDIVNRKRIAERKLHHDFIERNFPLPDDLKLVHSMAALWKDEEKRRRRRRANNQEDSYPSSPEPLVTLSSGSRDSQLQGWIHEEEYRNEVQNLISEDAQTLDGEALDFNTFVKPVEFEQDVTTALQSVEDLYPSSLKPALGLPLDATQSTIYGPESSIEVDEKQILQSQFEEADSDDDLLDDSDVPDHSEQGADVQQDQGEPPNLPESGSRPSSSDGEAHGIQPYQSISGICVSMLKTGKPHDMPVSRSLLAAAEEDGLITRIRQANITESESGVERKRGGSEMFPGHTPSKRPRLSLQHGSGAAGKVGIVDPVQAKVAQGQNLSSQRPEHASTKVGNTPFSDPGSSSSKKEGQRNVLQFHVPSKQPMLVMDEDTKHLNLPNSDEPAGEKTNQPSRGGIAGEGRDEKGNEDGQGLFPDRSSASSRRSTIDPKAQEAVSRYSRHPALLYAVLPPERNDKEAMRELNLPDVIYQDAYYSKEEDVPERNREYAGREYRLESKTLPFLPDFDPTGLQMAPTDSKASFVAEKARMRREFDRRRRNCSLRGWEFAQPPPCHRHVQQWDNETKKSSQERSQAARGLTRRSRVGLQSQIEGPTPKNKHGFKYTQRRGSTNVEDEAQYMSIMSLELHVNTRGNLFPDPEKDEIQCIFWSFKSDTDPESAAEVMGGLRSGVVALCKTESFSRQLKQSVSGDLVEEDSELDLIVRMVEIVRAYDPDILAGYEVHGGSWGYLIERASFKFDYGLCDELSRVKTDSHGRFGREQDRWGFQTTSTIRITGRHMINIWRAMRSELNLLQYTLENVSWHLLHRRVPHYSWKTLTRWHRQGKARSLSLLIGHHQARTRLDIGILEANELVPRISEQARLLGVDFFSVFSRGSQFKVESIMFRIAKPENLMLVSPSRKQVGGQNALECLPLVMEPQSGFYSSPMVVLDFQSLYPSLMIAYNYCYSTFLGRLDGWRGSKKMGFGEYDRPKGLLALLGDSVNVAPNGMMYVKAEVRRSLLAKMLAEILETRVMVKSAMKGDREDKRLQKLLNHRQLALKLLANVTYGYTSASFSGRMPCAEIADSIVQTGRETLERAMAYIHSVDRWGAEVVYGDTDSLFVYLKGRTREAAFAIGREMAEAISGMNPRPVKLKFEKVYHPCLLLAKKRYVGHKFESEGTAEPELEAKGIETVRRDGTPAEQKMEEQVLRLLFATADLSQVKAYFQAQCDKLMRGAVSLQDFCFAREVRLGSYADAGGPPPPGALISSRRMLADARAEPQQGERVPYLVVAGAPGARLVDRCLAPDELLSRPHCRLDADYYLTKNLMPPLERILNLVGADVRQWYDEMPKVKRVRPPTTSAAAAGASATLESYLRSTHCPLCGLRFGGAGADGPALCRRCRARAPASLLALQSRLAAEERRLAELAAACRTCAGLSPLEEVACESKDCPVFWSRARQTTSLAEARASLGPPLRALLEADAAALEW